MRLPARRPRAASLLATGGSATIGRGEAPVRRRLEPGRRSECRCKGHDRQVNLLLAAVAIVGVSASGPLMAYAAAPAMAIGFWRNALGTVVLAPFGWRRTVRELAGLDARGRWTIGFAGLMLALHFATWIYGLQLTSVAAATAMVSMQVVFVVLIDRVRGRRAPRQVVFGVALAIVGVLVITGVDFALSPRALSGDVLALAGGLTAALYLVAGSSLRVAAVGTAPREPISTTSYAVGCYAVCAIVLGVACLVARDDFVGYERSTWLAIIAVTVCAQLLGHTILNHLLAVMSPSLIALLLLLEVPGAALLAGWFLGQRPAAGVYLGLVVILAGLAVVTLRRNPPEAPMA